uniref:hypothetical protein n=1 Tax=Trichocoleus desertorum TaxID=1481672 RepID=UPI0025B5E925|nr:hypothetical protein [Trichocoleus desertorum]
MSTPTAIKERPILFSGAMVRAILRGENPKTQTRRVIKLPSWSTKNWDDFETDGKEAQIICANTGCLASIPCPYGKAGDRLWVRETWSPVQPTASGELAYDGARLIELDGYPIEVWYRADGEMGILCQADPEGPRWKPSIHMPRKVGRITLEVAQVRVERLQDISEEDAIAEGVAFENPSPDINPNFRRWFDYQGKEYGFSSPVWSFRSLWDSINGKTYPWESNPWLRVVEFKRIDGAIAAQTEVKL